MIYSISLALITSIFTAGGAILAIYAFRGMKETSLLLGFSAGLLLALAGFDLIPTVLKENKSEIGGVPIVALVLILGFLILHFAEKIFATHEPHAHSDGVMHEHHHPHQVGTLAGIALGGHVFLDGLGLGAAFRLSHSLGFAVFIAVAIHAFTDGLNTVSFIIKEGYSKSKVIYLISADAVSRVAGAAIGGYLAINESVVTIYLALFAGFVIYISTSHILPEAHAKQSSRLTMIATVVGVLVMWAVVALGA